MACKCTCTWTCTCMCTTNVCDYWPNKTNKLLSFMKEVYQSNNDNNNPANTVRMCDWMDATWLTSHMLMLYHNFYPLKLKLLFNVYFSIFRVHHATKPKYKQLSSFCFYSMLSLVFCSIIPPAFSETTSMLP